MALLDEQFLPVKGIPNARDLGGYKTADSMIVKSGMLIRGASLAMAKDADLKLLANLHVIKVIDFRTDFEKNGKENRPLPEGEILWRQGGRIGCGESFHWCQHGKFHPRPRLNQHGTCFYGHLSAQRFWFDRCGFRDIERALPE